MQTCVLYIRSSAITPSTPYKLKHEPPEQPFCWFSQQEPFFIFVSVSKGVRPLFGLDSPWLYWSGRYYDILPRWQQMQCESFVPFKLLPPPLSLFGPASHHCRLCLLRHILLDRMRTSCCQPMSEGFTPLLNPTCTGDQYSQRIMETVCITMYSLFLETTTYFCPQMFNRNQRI